MPRGRPALPPELRRIKRGVSLPPNTWETLARLADEAGESHDTMFERMITMATNTLPRWDVTFVATAREERDGADWHNRTVTVRAEDEVDALAASLKKIFGKQAGFHRDTELKTGWYGQVVVQVGTRADYNCLTSRIRVDVERADD